MKLLPEINRNLTFEDVLVTAMKTPGVKINRESFLRKELFKYYSNEVIDLAVRTNPAKAGIKKEIINEISLSVINYEAKKVTVLSVAASIPGGAAAVGAAAADITSYFAFVLRTVQELAYLYGFEEFDLNDESVDSETMQQVLVFIGTMFGVAQASSLLNKLADSIANNIAKNLAKKALKKTVYYPIVKQVAKKVGIRMTKQIFADTLASAVPVAGGLLSGGLTYAMFKPNCMKLRNTLMSYNICNPEFYRANN